MRNNPLARIRRGSRIPASRFFMQLIGAILLGILLGIVGKLADAYTEHMGKLFSGISFWIMLCTLISTCSASPWRAAAHVFSMCAFMVAAYYLTAELANLYYSMTFAYGWAAFAAFSPILAFAAWYSRERGRASKIIACGILAAMLIGTYVIFKIRLYDILFVAVTAVFLFRPHK